jgi:hypothetical protein
MLCQQSTSEGVQMSAALTLNRKTNPKQSIQRCSSGSNCRDRIPDQQQQQQQHVQLHQVERVVLCNNFDKRTISEHRRQHLRWQQLSHDRRFGKIRLQQNQQRGRDNSLRHKLDQFVSSPDNTDHVRRHFNNLFSPTDSITYNITSLA